MTTCPHCRTAVDELSTHYGSDACPALVTAFGAVTSSGKRAEMARDTSGRSERSTAARAGRLTSAQRYARYEAGRRSEVNARARAAWARRKEMER